MDIKIAGITREIMTRALAQARDARIAILDTMDSALGGARADISPFAPRIITITIHKDKIRDVIGPGGKMIRSIVERTGCKIEVNDDGRVDIASTDEDAAKKAVEIIRELTAEAELGRTYLGKVVRIVNFGAFVEVLPGVEGLLHISEIAEQRINEVRDELDDGQEILVKVIEIDGQGRVRLSRKAVLREQRGESAEPPREEGNRGPRPGDAGGPPHREGGSGPGGRPSGGQGGGRDRGPAGGGRR
jgi:polyribonucleotide nucleotidyltransferase